MAQITAEQPPIAISQSVRAIANKQAEAERLRRAKVTDGEGERRKLRSSCRPAKVSPASLQLRYLGTLLNIAGEKSPTIMFPVPVGPGCEIFVRKVSMKVETKLRGVDRPASRCE